MAFGSQEIDENAKNNKASFPKMRNPTAIARDPQVGYTNSVEVTLPHQLPAQQLASEESKETFLVQTVL